MDFKLFNYEEYCKGLKVLSYEEIIDILRNQDEQFIITFRSSNDYASGKKYTFVDVRNLSKDTYEEYLSPDQDDDEIHNNLGNKLEELSDDEHSFELHAGLYDCEYICLVGRNYVSFPRSIAKMYVKQLKH